MRTCSLFFVKFPVGPAGGIGRRNQESLPVFQEKLSFLAVLIACQGKSGSGFDPWALQVLEVSDGRIVELTFFLDTDHVFPLFGLPPRPDA